MKKQIMLSLIGFISISIYAQQNNEVEFKAEIVAGCFLEAENINFGILEMPLIDRSAQSNITVKCSKNTPLNISIDGLSFSEVDYTKLSSLYQQQLQNNELTLEYRGYNSSTKIHNYYIGRWSTSGVGNFYCGIGGTTNKPTDLVYQFFNAGVIGCNNDGTLTNFTGTPTVGMKISLLDYSSGSSSGKKVLNGLSHGETIKYLVIKPDTTDVWSSNYTMLSNGENQNIPLKLKINKSDNVTHRMTPDMYQSTLTVVLNY